MPNLQQVGIINEAPPPVVAGDTAQDTDLELLEKHARRQGVQALSDPPPRPTPLAVKLAVLWVYICINEGQVGVSNTKFFVRTEELRAILTVMDATVPDVSSIPKENGAKIVAVRAAYVRGDGGSCQGGRPLRFPLLQQGVL